MLGSGAEYDFCELPTIRQLKAMRQLPGDLGWNYIEANPFAPTPNGEILTYIVKQLRIPVC